MKIVHTDFFPYRVPSIVACELDPVLNPDFIFLGRFIHNDDLPQEKLIFKEREGAVNNHSPPHPSGDGDKRVIRVCRCRVASLSAVIFIPCCQMQFFLLACKVFAYFRCHFFLQVFVLDPVN